MGRISTDPNVSQRLALRTVEREPGEPPHELMRGRRVATRDARRQHAGRRNSDEVPPAADLAREVDPGLDLPLGLLVDQLRIHLGVGVDDKHLRRVVAELAAEIE